MRIENSSYNPAFKSGYVTLTRASLGEKIEREVVDVFNKRVASSLVSDAIADNMNFFVLAGGKGSRFSPLTKLLENVFGQQNKISLPFPLMNGKKLRIADFPMLMGKPFLDKGGYKTILNETPSGNLGEVISFYRQNPDKIKDTLICCGDNIHDLKTSELKKIIEKARAQKADALIFGSVQNPEAAAGRFGVLEFETADTDFYNLLNFYESPNLKTLLNPKNKFLTQQNNCISYPGMFYINAKSIKQIMENIENNPDYIRKVVPSTGELSTTEQFDFIAALTRLHKDYHDTNILIKKVDKWIDTGTVNDYFKFLNALKDGSFLQNFNAKDKQAIISSVQSDNVIYRAIAKLNGGIGSEG